MLELWPKAGYVADRRSACDYRRGAVTADSNRSGKTTWLSRMEDVLDLYTGTADGREPVASSLRVPSSSSVRSVSRSVQNQALSSVTITSTGATALPTIDGIGRRRNARSRMHQLDAHDRDRAGQTTTRLSKARRGILRTMSQSWSRY
jgi:hypothetical protein